MNSVKQAIEYLEGIFPKENIHVAWLPVGYLPIIDVDPHVHEVHLIGKRSKLFFDNRRLCMAMLRSPYWIAREIRRLALTANGKWTAYVEVYSSGRPVRADSLFGLSAVFYKGISSSELSFHGSWDG